MLVHYITQLLDAIFSNIGIQDFQLYVRCQRVERYVVSFTHFLHYVAVLNSTLVAILFSGGLIEEALYYI